MGRPAHPGCIQIFKRFLLLSRAVRAALAGSPRSFPLSVQVESLFTAALGLQAPWQVVKVDLDTAKRRIDFEVDSTAKRLSCPNCGAADQGIHDRIRRDWRHLDFFQFEAWLHADVPRVGCTGCGKTTQVPVPWAREVSGFTLLFEALAITMCPCRCCRPPRCFVWGTSNSGEGSITT